MKKALFIIVILIAVVCLTVGGYLFGVQQSNKKTNNTAKETNEYSNLSFKELDDTMKLLKKYQDVRLANDMIEGVKKSEGDIISLPQVGNYIVVSLAMCQVSGYDVSYAYENFDYDRSYVLVFADGSKEKPEYHYMVSLVDVKGNGIPLTKEGEVSLNSLEDKTASQKLTTIDSLAKISKNDIGNTSLAQDTYELEYQYVPYIEQEQAID